MTPESFDTWFPRVTKALAFVLGMAIMAGEALLDHNDRPWLYAAAITLIGLPAAQAVERLVGKATGTGEPGGTPTTSPLLAPPNLSQPAPAMPVTSSLPSPETPPSQVTGGG